MYDYVLFDLDGTLTRSGDGIKNSAAHAIARLGYAPLTGAQLDKFVGPPLLESFMELCGMDESTALKAVELYRERFESVGWRENAVYPGIAPLLRALRAAGKYVAIATAKPEYFAVRIAEYFGMAPYLNAIIGIPMTDHQSRAHRPRLARGGGQAPRRDGGRPQIRRAGRKSGGRAFAGRGLRLWKPCRAGSLRAGHVCRGRIFPVCAAGRRASQGLLYHL